MTTNHHFAGAGSLCETCGTTLNAPIHSIPARPDFTYGEALATLAGVGTEYIVCYEHRTGQFLAGLSGRTAQPQFVGSWLECLAWAGNRIAAEVELEEDRPEGERLAIVTPEGDVR